MRIARSPPVLPLILAMTLVLAGLPPTGTARAEPTAPHWTVQPDSTLAFAYRGSPISGQGRFERFDAEIFFDPADPAATRLTVTIATDSVRLTAPQAQRMIGAPRWFDLDRFPTARFVAEGATALGPDGQGGHRFESQGRLAWKDATVDIPIAFTVLIDGDRAVATVTATVDRRSFGIGTADAEEDAAIAGEVSVTATLQAVRTDPPGR